VGLALWGWRTRMRHTAFRHEIKSCRHEITERDEEAVHIVFGRLNSGFSAGQETGGAGNRWGQETGGGRKQVGDAPAPKMKWQSVNHRRFWFVMSSVLLCCERVSDRLGGLLLEARVTRYQVGFRFADSR